MRLPWRLRLVALSLFLAVLPAVAVAQATTRVTVGSNALLIGLNPFGQSQVNVPVKAECGGISGSVSVQVTQPRAPFGAENGFGGVNVTCDGQAHDYVVSVFGPSFPGFQ